MANKPKLVEFQLADGEGDITKRHKRLGVCIFDSNGSRPHQVAGFCEQDYEIWVSVKSTETPTSNDQLSAFPETLLHGVSFLI